MKIEVSIREKSIYALGKELVKVLKINGSFVDVESISGNNRGTIKKDVLKNKLKYAFRF